MRVATVQLAIDDSFDKEQKICKVEEIILALPQVDFVILPELWNIGFFSFDNYKELSESIDGMTFTRLSALAKKINAYIFTGSIVEKRGDKYYNTCGIINREGKLLGDYSKIHLFSAETKRLNAGDKFTVVDTEFGKIGLSICYDIRFPELYRKLIDMGAEVLINCAAWPYPRVENWMILNQARALENQSYFLSCVCAGKNEGNPYIGRSMVVDPWGTIVGTLSEREGVMINDIYPENVKKIREEFTPLKDIKISINGLK